MNRDLIIEVIKETLELEDFKETDALLNMLGDSLEVFEAIMYIEDEFDINIPIDNTIVTFGDLLNIVEKAINGKKTSII